MLGDTVKLLFEELYTEKRGCAVGDISIHMNISANVSDIIHSFSRMYPREFFLRTRKSPTLPNLGSMVSSS
jgi:hypothetical protein